MVVGIDGSRAFLAERTGIEEYSYQVIKHLRSELVSDCVVLYVKKNFEFRISNFESNPNIQNSELNIQSKFKIGNLEFISRLQPVDFNIPKNWVIKGLYALRLWTQFRLSWEMLFHPVDVLFVPAHTVPLIHPKKTIVTIHGLEYEFCPGAYSFLERWYMRFSIRFSSWAASRLIAVSENTRKDLISLYGVAKGKITVIYEGYEQNFQFPISNFPAAAGPRQGGGQSSLNSQNSELKIESKFRIKNSKFLLFIGRLEERKNVVRIVEAFEILKEKYQIPHQLILAGKNGYGYEKVRLQIAECRFKNDIQELGYVSEEEKWALLRGADVFLFPSLYEGFGIPVLEAQSVGTPVVTSQGSSLPEVGGAGAVYVDPLSAESIALGIHKVLTDEELRGDIIRLGKKNIERFGWGQCAREICGLLRQDQNEKIKMQN